VLVGGDTEVQQLGGELLLFFIREGRQLSSAACPTDAGA
jgi:hypothetical protein